MVTDHISRPTLRRPRRIHPLRPGRSSVSSCNRRRYPALTSRDSVAHLDVCSGTTVSHRRTKRRDEVGDVEEEEDRLVSSAALKATFRPKGEPKDGRLVTFSRARVMIASRRLLPGTKRLEQAPAKNSA
jgi:hypothetical protein